jgi:hypothetical protein
MTEWNTPELIEADKKFVWHPFRNTRDQSEIRLSMFAE